MENTLLYKAMAAEKDGRIDEARTIFNQIIATSPENPHANLFLAMLESNAGNFKSSFKHIITAGKFFSDDIKFQNNFGLISMNKRKEIMRQMEEALNHINEIDTNMLFRNKNHAKAILCYDPKDFFMYFMYSLVIAAQGDLAGCEKNIRRAIECANADNRQKILYFIFLIFGFGNIKNIFPLEKLVGIMDDFLDKDINNSILRVCYGLINFSIGNIRHSIPFMKECKNISENGRPYCDLIFYSNVNLSQYYLEIGNYAVSEHYLSLARQIDMGGVPRDSLSEIENKINNAIGRKTQSRILPSTQNSEADFHVESLSEIDKRRLEKLPSVDTVEEIPALVRWLEINPENKNIEEVIRLNVMNGLRLPHKLFEKKSIGLTLGSCFAQNIANSLIKLGVDVFRVSIHEDINSTYALCYFFDYLVNGVTDENTASIDAIFYHNKDKIIDRIKRSDFIILTVGVAPAYFTKSTGEFIFLSQSKYHNYSNKIESKTPSTNENKVNIDKIIKFINIINSNASIFLTLSPVPLAATKEFSSAVIADCVSKSVLRAAIFEVLRDNPDVYYWPSFEIVRWLSGHVNQAFFGNYDSRHVNTDILDTIMKIFIDICFKESDAESSMV